jgi:hypothetical protein
MKIQNKINIYLTCGGCLPFVLCCLFLAQGINTVPYLGNTAEILQVYGLVIVSFMSGVHWGQYLSWTINLPFSLPIISNVIAIFVWVSFLLASTYQYLFMLILVFILLLLIDLKLYEKKYLTLLYFRTRVFVTLVVIFSLFVSLILLE